MWDPEVKHPLVKCLLCSTLAVGLLCIKLPALKMNITPGLESERLFLIWQINYQRVYLFGLASVKYLSCSVPVEALAGVSEDASSE